MKLQLAIELDKPLPTIQESVTEDVYHPDVEMTVEEAEIEVDLEEFLSKLDKG